MSAKQGVTGRGKKKSHHRKRYCFVVNLKKLTALRIAALTVKIYGRVKKKKKKKKCNVSTASFTCCVTKDI